MKVINSRNVNGALSATFALLNALGVKTQSRAGSVLYSPEPVAAVFERPEERVLFHPVRDANPFFHLYESLWMLAGRDDVDSLAKYNARMKEFSDDGKRFWGSAYGYRWRRFFGFDQLIELVHLLKSEPLTRRAVLTMWSPRGDLLAIDDGAGAFASKDVPCNQQIFFSAVSGRLDMTVTNRSNDAVWGAFGANYVQFSTLQEVIAGALNIPLGRYWQVSNNLHIYDERPDVIKLQAQLKSGGLTDDRYASGDVTTFKLYREGMPLEEFLSAVEEFVAAPEAWQPMLGMSPPFLYEVAQRMMCAHAEYRSGAIAYMGGVSNDWLVAGNAWLERRLAARRAAE